MRVLWGLGFNRDFAASGRSNRRLHEHATDIPRYPNIPSARRFHDLGALKCSTLNKTLSCKRNSGSAPFTALGWHLDIGSSLNQGPCLGSQIVRYRGTRTRKGTQIDGTADMV